MRRRNWMKCATSLEILAEDITISVMVKVIITVR